MFQLTRMKDSSDYVKQSVNENTVELDTLYRDKDINTMEYTSLSSTHSTYHGIEFVFQPFGSTVFYGIFLFISIGSVVGNSLVIAAYKIDKSLRKRPTNTLLISLAVTDFLTGLIAIPFYTLARGIKSDFTCSGNTRFLLFFPGMLFGVSSVTHLTVIAMDR